MIDSSRAAPPQGDVFVAPDGTVCRPLSGFFDAVVEPEGPSGKTPAGSIGAGMEAGAGKGGGKPPAGSSDAVVGPDPGEGGPLQRAISSLRPGGSVLVRPGAYSGSLELKAEAHVFGERDEKGRGATLTGASGSVLCSTAARATVDGLAIARAAGGSGSDSAVWIGGGRLRLRACD